MPPEPRGKRLLFLGMALAIVAGYFYLTQSFWVPADGGIDQNGYLVGGKMIAEHFSPSFTPGEPYEYVGWMWVRTNGGAYYPKYPLGLPLLHAIPLWINWSQGKVWALQVVPVCTALSLLGMFFLTRAIAGSFLAVLSMLLLGCADDPGDREQPVEPWAGAVLRHLGRRSCCCAGGRRDASGVACWPVFFWAMP